MTTKRANRRKPKSGHGITLAKSSDTRAKRKAVTARKMAAAARKVATEKKVAVAPVAKKKAVKKAAAPAAKK